MEYGYSRVVDFSFEDADRKIRESLQENGFGVLSEIDVQSSLKKKLNVDFRKYRILGACNPPIAHKALSTDLHIGLLLPCNVVIWDNEDGTTTVSAIDAGKMLSITGRDDMAELAQQVNQLLKNAVDAL